MAVKYTEEQLNSADKSFLIQLLLQQQEQLEAITKELHASNEKSDHRKECICKLYKTEKSYRKWQ